MENMNTDNIKLLPCPFCGGKAKYIKRSKEAIYQNYMPEIMCESCCAKATLSYDFIGNYKEELEKKWNTRKPMQEIVERLEEEKVERYKEWLETSHFKDLGAYQEVKRIIEIVKEVGGLDG